MNKTQKEKKRKKNKTKLISKVINSLLILSIANIKKTLETTK